MQIWLDTTDFELIQVAKEMGILYGITTNPIILDGSFSKKQSVIDELLSVQDGPVAVQVVSTNPEEMKLEVKQIRALSPRIIVKIPATPEGFKCMNTMRATDIPIMATTIIEAQQVLFSSIIGANYAAVYLKAVEKQNGDYVSDIKKMLLILQQQGFKTQLLTASIKSVDQVLTCAELGVPAITLPADIFKKLIASNELVEDYIKRFSVK